MKRTEVKSQYPHLRPKEVSETSYKVMRDCCTSGNCINCQDLPLGKKHRVSQMGDVRLTKERADMIANNWASYRPTVEEWEE